MKTPLILLLYLCLTLSPARASESRFAIVLIDTATEQQYGEFPLDRRIIAQGINRLADMRPKGLVLKFFYDLPKDSEGDAALARAISRVPTILQARIDDTEPKPNPFPERCYFAGLPPRQVQAFGGQSGWMPLPLLSEKARDIGFVDVPDIAKTSIVEKYQGRIVRSLVLCSLELAFVSNATIIPGKSLSLGNNSIPLDDSNSVPIQFPPADRLEYLKFHDLLAGKINPQQITGKVVILGYDGAKIPRLQTPLGLIGAHRYFIYSLQDLSDRLDQAKAKAAN